MATAPAIHPVQLLTADDLWSLPDPPGDGRYELVRGVLVEVSPSSTRSNEVSGEMIRRVGNHVREHGLGRFGGSEGGFTLQRSPDTVRAPDVWFVRAERAPSGRMPDGFFDGVPDLAVEVLSPSDCQGDIWRRIADYVDAGTPLIWVLDPKTESAIALPRDEMPLIIPADGALDGGDILPGFVLPLRDIFGA
jgi:Uma2 family endonuclease